MHLRQDVVRWAWALCLLGLFENLLGHALNVIIAQALGCARWVVWHSRKARIIWARNGVDYRAGVADFLPTTL
jgi:hypothetical protein